MGRGESGNEEFVSQTRSVAEAAGITVSIEVSDDGVPVVLVDTSIELESPSGPRIRIRLNDEPVYVGVERADTADSPRRASWPLDDGSPCAYCGSSERQTGYLGDPGISFCADCGNSPRMAG